MSKPVVFGLIGLKGSGKSMVAKYLSQYLIPIKFAGPLKDMTKVLLRGLGFSLRDTEQYLEGCFKEDTIPCLGKSSREIQQTLGTDWAREMIHQDIWLTCFKATVEKKSVHGDPFVCDDVRFINEANLIQKEMGGILIRIIRDSASQEDNHQSEKEMSCIKEDYTVYNNGTEQELFDQIDKIIKEIK